MSESDYAQVSLTAQIQTESSVLALVQALHTRGTQIPLAVTETSGFAVAALLLAALCTDLQYSVQVTLTAAGQVILWGEKQHEILALRTEHDGHLEIDQAGVIAGGCRGRLAELANAAEQRGLTLGLGTPRPHGDPRGGELIRNLGRPSLAKSEIVALERTRAPIVSGVSR